MSRARVVVAVTLSVMAHLGGTRLLAQGARPSAEPAPERIVMALAALPPAPAPAPPPPAPAPVPPPAAPAPPPPPEPRPVQNPKPRPAPGHPAEAAPSPVPPVDAPPPATDVPPTNTPGVGSGVGVGGPGGGVGPGSGGGGGGRPAPAAPPAPARRAPALVPVAARELGERPRPPALGGELARRYPPDARRLGVSGEAAVRALIGPGGRVERADVDRESRSGFGAACRAALLASRWSSPRDKAGRAVATWIRYTCRFEIAR